MIDSTFGISSAAETPWTRRARTSSVGVAAAPQAADAIVKSVSPAANIRRRPKAVAEPGAGDQEHRRGERVAGYTHSIEPALAWSWDWIDGSATLTMKKSRTTMQVPASSTGSGAQRLRARAASGCRAF